MIFYLFGESSHVQSINKVVHSESSRLLECFPLFKFVLLIFHLGLDTQGLLNSGGHQDQGSSRLHLDYLEVILALFCITPPGSLSFGHH